MGQFVMSFRGLNMHVKKISGVLPADVHHRVVAVDASQGYQSHDWGAVPPHHCIAECKDEIRQLLLESGLPPFGEHAVSLQGCRVRLFNAAGHRPDVRLENVPALKTFLGDMTLKDGIGNETEVPDWAACFLDINSGTITRGQFEEGGFYTTWSAETFGDPVLEIARAGQDTVRVTLPSTPPLESHDHHLAGSIVMNNGTNDLTDKEYDFVLYFLANQQGVPARAQLTKMFPIDPVSRTASVDLTTSCSNSQYP